MAKVDLYDFYDVLSVARDMGYDWNKAHDFLSKDILPWPGEYKIEHNLSDLSYYGHSADTIVVMEKFFETHKITSFVLTR